jgi:hypothetical protein
MLASTQTTELSTEISNQNSEVGTSTTSILIAYFSRADNIVFDPNIDAVASASINLNGSEVSGNAELLAQMAETVTGGDIFSIETVNKYPSDDFTDKTILPLSTHEGSGLGNTEKEIAAACPQATVSGGLAVRGGKAAGAQSDVEEWLKN